MTDLSAIARAFTEANNIVDSSYPDAIYLPVARSVEEGKPYMLEYVMYCEEEWNDSYLNYSCSGSTAPVVFLPSDWDGSEFGVFPIDVTNSDSGYRPAEEGEEPYEWYRVADEDEIAVLAASEAA